MNNELPGNPFIDETARSDYETVDGIGNAYATLTLASEQARTADALEVANLIAYLNTAGLYRLASPAPEAVLKSVQAQVEVRLGLA